MSFLHPWLLAGLAAVGVPLWLHLRARTGPARPFSAVRFLEDQPRPRIRGFHLRDLLLFLARAAAVGLVAAGVCGAYGNRWYLAHARKAISEARDRGLDPYAVSAFAADRGGTSLGASVGLFLLFLFLTVGVALLLQPYLYPA